MTPTLSRFRAIAVETKERRAAQTVGCLSSRVSGSRQAADTWRRAGGGPKVGPRPRDGATRALPSDMQGRPLLQGSYTGKSSRARRARCAADCVWGAAVESGRVEARRARRLRGLPGSRIHTDTRAPSRLPLVPIRVALFRQRRTPLLAGTRLDTAGVASWLPVCAGPPPRHRRAPRPRGGSGHGAAAGLRAIRETTGPQGGLALPPLRSAAPRAAQSQTKGHLGEVARAPGGRRHSRVSAGRGAGSYHSSSPSYCAPA